VGAVSYVAHALFGVGGDGADRLFDIWLYNAIAAIALGLCIVRAVTVKRERAAWISMSIAIGAWIAASLSAGLSGEAIGQHPAAGITDILHLIFFPAAGAALCLLVRSRVEPFQPSILLDGAIVALAVTAIGSAILFQTLGDSAIADLTLRLSFPLGNLMLLTFSTWILALVGWRAGLTWDLIFGGMVIAAVASAAHLIEIASGTPTSGNVLELLWPIAAMMLALAAWQEPGNSIKPKLDGYRNIAVSSTSAGGALAVLLAGQLVSLKELTITLACATLLALIVRATVIFRENLEMVEDFRYEAQTDSLTGLGNRRKLLTDLRRELVNASVQSPRILVIYDLDGFKRYNDTYGHPAGDTLLQRLGGNLARAIGPYGHGYRLGGDEFCVLVTTGGSSAKTIISLTSAALSEQGEGFSVTASYGAVILPHEARDPSLALRIADQRMYSQKEDRRSSATRQTRDILMQVLHEREPELGEHMMDVAKLARGVGTRMELPTEDLDEVVRAAELHDVGKMAIPDEILHKPAALDDSEWEFIRQHTIVGERILKAAPSLLPVAKIVRSSHERWDGCGYPDRLAAEAIPLGSRIVAACDAFDAMTTCRPYREPMSGHEALEELRRNAGTQFDPQVVDALCQEVQASGYRLGSQRMAA
jgi:diguanylate cyclase (GGDEF)-like protein